jgi:hypothetical protein
MPKAIKAVTGKIATIANDPANRFNVGTSIALVLIVALAEPHQPVDIGQRFTLPRSVSTHRT